MRRLLPVLAASLALSAPALAGPAELAFLAKLPGTWSGTGTISGAESGAITCTLTLRGTDKINFAGNCNAGHFGPQTFNGVLTYNDAAKQYQARSNGETVAGIKSGNSVIFKGKMKTVAGSGDSIMKMSSTSIVVDLDITRTDSGDKIQSHVVFAKN